MSGSAALLTRVQEFIDADFDEECQRELRALLERARRGDGDALHELDDRFRGPLEFGTAGLRGLIGAGETRMNRAVVSRTTYGLVSYLISTVENAKERGLVIGRDGRRLSDRFQRDAAEIALALGMRVHLIDTTAPTPVTAFAVKELAAAAGVMITASHNPPAYNGYKVYWENGAQIIPPHDVGIANAIAAAPRACDLPRVASDRLINDATGIVEKYVEALDALRFVDAPVGELSIAYSAMHGVGERVFRAVVQRRGFEKVYSVAEQAEPDGTFPTVEFPNPEEPGALDRVLALAGREACDVVLVNDPDADRLAVAARHGDEYVVLNGNEIGVLLGHHVLARTHGDERLVIATVVSSQLLRRVATALGARYAETLTGFKWIANEAIAREREEAARFVFGYEEALGYTVGTLVRDKDGVSAALVMAELAAHLKSQGRTLVDELEAIWRRFGFLQSHQKSVTLPGREGAERIVQAMTTVRMRPPQTLAGVRVSAVRDLKPRGDVLILDLEDESRIAIRPSGTEPKIKIYFEILETLRDGESPSTARERGKPRLKALERAILEATGLSA